MNKNNNIQIKFANAAGMLASRFSLSPTVGQLYGLLYMSPQPVSLNEMVKKIGISKGAVSTNIRILESWGAVKKVWVDNSRKDYYEANPDTLEILTKRIKEGISRRMEEVKIKISEIQKDIDNKKSDGSAKENSEFYNKRINQAKEMYESIEGLLDFLPGE